MHAAGPRNAARVITTSHARFGRLWPNSPEGCAEALAVGELRRAAPWSHECSALETLFLRQLARAHSRFNARLREGRGFRTSVHPAPKPGMKYQLPPLANRQSCTEFFPAFGRPRPFIKPVDFSPARHGAPKVLTSNSLTAMAPAGALWKMFGRMTLNFLGKPFLGILKERPTASCRHAVARHAEKCCDWLPASSQVARLNGLALFAMWKARAPNGCRKIRAPLLGQKATGPSGLTHL